MSNYQVLGTSESKEWHFYLSKIENVDIYFTPEYCKIYENNQEGIAKLFVFNEGEYYICYPYILRQINKLPLLRFQNTPDELYDIITPYGYGGPITNATNDVERKQIFERFSKTFSTYCKNNSIVTEFVRFHPLLGNGNDYQAVNPTNIRNTIYMDLGSEQSIFDSIKNKCRNRLKYALSHGLVACQEDIDNLDTFLDMYYATMDKNNADQYYYFSKDYFRDTIHLLKNHVSIFTVRYDNKIIASAFFLHYKDHVAYHLTGSVKEYLKYAPYNLLITYAAERFKEKGYKYLHLGGGYTGEDELLRFKKTFSKQPQLNFYIGHKVHCPKSYALLTEGLEDIQDSFFPLYRHPSLYNEVYGKEI